MLLVKNQKNNWAYVLILVVITAVAATGIIIYAQDTMEEIRSLSAIDLIE